MVILGQISVRRRAMKSYRLVLVLFLSFLLLSCAKGGTYSLYLQYQPVKDFSSLQQKVGASLGIGQFKDQRSNLDTSFIGIYTSPWGAPDYFKSEPFPLEKGIRDSISQALSQRGVKTVSVSDWNGQLDTLQNVETDSVLTVEIKQFWTEAKRSLFRTHVLTKISFTIHLGVKKEGKVFMRKVGLEREMSVPSWNWDRERMEQSISQVLSSIFDEFFSNPY